MKNTMTWGMALILAATSAGVLAAETAKPVAPARLDAEPAAWERVGDAGTSGRPTRSTKIRAADDEALPARRAEMVRRMFWIVLAHH